MDFDINTLRSIATVVSLITFLGIVVWAWSRRNASDFEGVRIAAVVQRQGQGHDSQ